MTHAYGCSRLSDRGPDDILHAMCNNEVIFHGCGFGEDPTDGRPAQPSQQKKICQEDLQSVRIIGLAILHASKRLSARVVLRSHVHVVIRLSSARLNNRFQQSRRCRRAPSADRHMVVFQLLHPCVLQGVAYSVEQGKVPYFTS